MAPLAPSQSSPDAPHHREIDGTDDAAKTLSKRNSEHVRRKRRLERLTKSGLFSGNLLGARIERARSFEDLQQAYRLVHDVYVEAGYIRPYHSGIRLRMFEASPEEATFVAKVGEKIVGVISIAADVRGLGLPSDFCFKEELDEARSRGLRLAEMTNQAVAEGYRQSAVATELMRCAAAHVIRGCFDEAFAAISPNHSAFYKLLGFREVGSPRSYSDTVHDPVLALGVELQQFRKAAPTDDGTRQFVHDFLVASNPFMNLVQPWGRDAEARFRDARLLRRLFISETAFITQCSTDDLAFLQRIWGRRLFDSTTGRSLLTQFQKWSSAFLTILKIMDDRQPAASSFSAKVGSV